MLCLRMNGFHGPVHLLIRPSTWLPRALMLAHGVTLIMLWFAYPHALSRSVLLAAVAAHGCWQLHGCMRPRPDQITHLELGRRQAWRVTFFDGRIFEARLLRAVVVSPLLTALTLRLADGARREVLLLPDMVEADAFRRLRVRLLHESRPA